MPDPNAKRLFWYLFAGTKGGAPRAKIINMLKEHPYNINQLAAALNLDYKAAQHHIKVLERKDIVNKIGKKYGILYFVSPYLDANMEAYNDMMQKIIK